MDAILGKVGSYWIGKKARRSTPSETISMSYIDINECTSPLVGHSSIMEVYGGGWCHNLCASISKSCPHGKSMSTSIGGTRWLVNKFKGKMQKPLPELLKEYDLAAGIFPRDATNYEFDVETRKLIVYTPSICEVGYRDSSVLRFSTIVTGFLENGKLANIEGMKTKVMIWAKVTCISANGGKLHFTTGMKKTRSRAVYEVLRDGVSVDKF